MPDIHDGTGAGMIAFLEWAGAKGEISDARASNLRTAATRVLSVEADQASVDISTVDTEALLDRFAILNRAKYNTASMQAYKARFRQAVAMYASFLEGSATWKSIGTLSKIQGKNSDAPRILRRKPSAERVTPAASSRELSSTPSPSVDRGSQLVAYDLPLRPDLLVRLTLPVSLTKADADRIARFVQSLAFSSDSSPATTDGPTEQT